MKKEKNNWEKELREKARNSPSCGRCARVLGVEFLIRDFKEILEYEKPRRNNKRES